MDDSESGPYLGTIATARSGAPLPPPTFIGSANTTAPRAGSDSRCARFSRAGTFAAARMRCVSYVVDCPRSMLAVSMPTRGRPLVPSPATWPRRDADPGSATARHRPRREGRCRGMPPRLAIAWTKPVRSSTRLPRAISPCVGFPVRARRQPTPGSPRPGRACRDVDDDGRADEAGEWHLLGGLLAFGEMNGRVHMRAAVLGGVHVVGGVVPAARRDARKHLLEAERVGRRPHHGVARRMCA